MLELFNPLQPGAPGRNQGMGLEFDLLTVTEDDHNDTSPAAASRFHRGRRQEIRDFSGPGGETQDPCGQGNRWQWWLKYAIIAALDHVIRGETEWVCRGHFTFPVPPDPKHVCLRTILHSGGIGNGYSARKPRKGFAHDRSGHRGHRFFGRPRHHIRSALIPIPRRRTGVGPWRPHRRKSPAAATPERGGVALSGAAPGG